MEQRPEVPRFVGSRREGSMSSRIPYPKRSDIITSVVAVLKLDNVDICITVRHS